MKIKYLPASPKYPQTEHVRNDIGATLIAAGFAEAVVMPARGTRGWLEAMAEEEANRKPSIYDVVPPGANGIEWSVKTLLSGKVNVIKKVDGQVFFLNAPPADAPKNIHEQFKAACAVNPGANAEQLEAARRAQNEYDAKVKTARRW